MNNNEGETRICICDFNGRSNLLGHTIYLGADYFVESKEVCFSGMWCNVPNMPSNTVPTEDEVEDWAKKHNSIYHLRTSAELQQNKKRDEYFKRITKIYDKYGANEVTVTLKKDGDIKVISSIVGIRSYFEVLQAVGYNIKTKNKPYYGYKIIKFDFKKNIPDSALKNLIFPHESL